MRTQPFTPPTIVAANEFLAESIRTHAQLNQMVLRLGLEAEIPAEDTLGIGKKCDRLGRTILDRATVPVETLDGTLSLAEAFVREAVNLAEDSSTSARQRDLLRGLAQRRLCRGLGWVEGTAKTAGRLAGGGQSAGSGRRGPRIAEAFRIHCAAQASRCGD